MSEHGQNPNENEDVRFEPTDIATRPVLISVLSLAVFTVIFTFIGHLVYYSLAARQQAASPAVSPLAEKYAAKEPPAPRLQIDPKLDLEMLHAAEDKILHSYAWVDKEAGVVQVPIERAMEMLLAKGLPARQGPVPAKMAPRGVAPSQASEGSGAPDWREDKPAILVPHGSPYVGVHAGHAEHAPAAGAEADGH
ncbi:MAG: hypothetical protein ABR587_14050 [Candidatus Binatia bacterium]